MNARGLLSLDRVLWTRYVSVNVLEAVAAEIDRAARKFGTQTDLRDGYGPAGYSLYPWFPSADGCRTRTEMGAKDGTVTWADVLAEEVTEAFAERDPGLLRAELIQVAAVAMRWVEAIEARTWADRLDAERQS